MLVLLSGESNIYAVSEYDSQIMQQDEIELPSALADDDSFNELPFEQLRQALREEIEHDPKKEFKFASPKKYNLLIR